MNGYEGVDILSTKWPPSQNKNEESTFFEHLTVLGANLTVFTAKLNGYKVNRS
jgi:hypothetical protein